MLIHEQFSRRRVPIFYYLSFIILILCENENCALDYFFSLSIETHVGRKAQQEPATINNKSAVQFYALSKAEIGNEDGIGGKLNIKRVHLFRC